MGGGGTGPAEFNPRSPYAKILENRGYTFGALLGQGSYAKVYLTDWTQGIQSTTKSIGSIKSLTTRSIPSKIQLACKLIDTDIAPKEFVNRFLPREIETLKKVNYKFCLRLHSLITWKNIYFIFMEYCPNGDLTDFLKANGAIREAQARIWFSQIIKALIYLHNHSIVHRDVKPENVLLTGSYNTKLSDFGFARCMTSSEKHSKTFCGSLGYAAPEILRGIPYDPYKSDAWAAGVLLFAMVNRSLPFDDEHVRKLYEAQRKRNWKFRPKILKIVSKELKDFLFRALDPDPLTRPGPSEMWKLPWLQGRPPSQKFTPPPSPVSSVLERNRIYWEEEEQRKAKPASPVTELLSVPENPIQQASQNQSLDIQQEKGGTSIHKPISSVTIASGIHNVSFSEVSIFERAHSTHNLAAVAQTSIKTQPSNTTNN